MIIDYILQIFLLNFWSNDVNLVRVLLRPHNLPGAVVPHGLQRCQVQQQRQVPRPLRRAYRGRSAFLILCTISLFFYRTLSLFLSNSLFSLSHTHTLLFSRKARSDAKRTSCSLDELIRVLSFSSFFLFFLFHLSTLRLFL